MILLSPTKTMQHNPELVGNEPPFNHDAHSIMAPYKHMNESELQLAMNIKGKVLETTKNYIEAFGTRKYANLAIYAYQGIGFRCLDAQSFKLEDLEKKVLILSALYGILRVSDQIECYRMDFVIQHRLYMKWKAVLTDYLNQLDVPCFYSLASNEYEAMLDQKAIHAPIIHFVFYQGSKKAPSSFAKQVRGTLAHMMIALDHMNQTTIQALTPMNYVFDKEASTDSVWVYRRENNETN